MRRTEEQLECLATWKEGSLRYLMGRVQHQGAISDEDRYRCFVYEKLASSNASERHRTTILLAQSGDASCSGLTSPTEGSRTLRLTKGTRLRSQPTLLPVLCACVTLCGGRRSFRVCAVPPDAFNSSTNKRAESLVRQRAKRARQFDFSSECLPRSSPPNFF